LLYQRTPKWRARVLAQYQDDRHGHELSISALAACDFTARTALSLGYNRRRHVPPQRIDLGADRPRQRGLREALLPVLVL